MDQNPTQTNPQTAPNPGHPHKWLVGALIALLVIAIAVTVIYLINKRINPEEQMQEENMVPSNPALSEVEGWQTYRNEEYGFEFKYPPLNDTPFISVEKPSAEYDEFLLQVRVNYNYKTVGGEVLGPYSLFRISLDDNPLRQSIEEWFKGDDERCTGFLLDSNFYSIVEQGATEVLYPSHDPLPEGYDIDFCGPVGPARYVNSPNKDLVLGLLWSYQDHDFESRGYENYDDIFQLNQNILSTFRFLP